MTGKSKSSASALVKSKQVIPESAVDPDDAPEWTEEMWDRAEIRHGDKLIRPGRPPLDEISNGVKIRLDADVLESYRALGAGWQTQLNADLRRVRKLGAKVKKAV